MTRQLPKPVVYVVGWTVCGAIYGFLYGGGWVLMRWDDLVYEYRIRRVGVRVEEWLKDGAR
ncbi:hypothetical protein ACNQP7_31680 [Mycolicibacterium fortuitum]|uniref:hypothetical protein n=1 Tax=Mycolicibacterium fortuitum TaxID=1766 RepID=UPI003AABC748